MYLPSQAVIQDITIENSRIKTYTLAFTDKEYQRNFSYAPGQFMMVSVPHCGEAPISFASSPTRPGTIELSVRKAGELTSRLHSLPAGSMIGLRGPYGKPFPMEELAGKDLLFVAGGIGLAPLRSVITFCLDSGKYGTITLLYGSRTPEDIAFQADIEMWRKAGVDCRLTVDESSSDWQGNVGVVTTLLPQTMPLSSSTVSLVCGPLVMIDFVIKELTQMGLKDEDIITTMERHMKCGVGVCGHCHMDDKMICVDGPVFSKKELTESVAHFQEKPTVT